MKVQAARAQTSNKQKPQAFVFDEEDEPPEPVKRPRLDDFPRPSPPVPAPVVPGVARPVAFISSITSAPPPPAAVTATSPIPLPQVNSFVSSHSSQGALSPSVDGAASPLPTYSSAPLPTAPAPSDPDVKNVIDKFVDFAARNGPEFEQVARKNNMNNERFRFLFDPSCPEHAYYQYRLDSARRAFQSSTPSSASSSPAPVSVTGPNGDQAPYHPSIPAPPSFSDRPSSSFSERPGGFSDRPGGDRPSGFSDRPPGGFSDRPGGDRQSGFGDRPSGGFGDRPGGDRPSGFSERPSGGLGFNERPSGFNERPSGFSERASGLSERGFIDRPRDTSSSASVPEDSVARMEYFFKAAREKDGETETERIDRLAREKWAQENQEAEEEAIAAGRPAEKRKGGHHIGDFIPKEELNKFMSKKDQDRAKSEPFAQHRLDQSNVGHRLLQKMGWTEGSGLGATGQGIVTPIGPAGVKSDALGVGAAAVGEVTSEDDIYEQYKKRMMLGYRFRPNPLNNPRKPYY